MKSKGLSRQKFSYDLAGLSAYVDQLSPDIISEAVLSPQTMKYVNVIPGIKGTQNVNLLSETLEVQTGTSCGWTNSGDTTFTVVPVTVQALKVNQSLCLEELNTLWLGQYLSDGSYNTEAPFENAIVELQTKQIKRYNENLLWGASSASSSFSGFIELLDNTAGVVKLTGATALCSVTGTSIQDKAEKVLEQIDNIIEELDDNIYGRDDLVIFMSQRQFKCYLKSIRQVNNFHFSEPTLGQVYETFHPQTNIKVVGVSGLDAASSDLIACGPQQYFMAGTDLMSDEDSFRAWFSVDFQEVRIMSAWKIGSAIAFPQFFVTNGL